MRAAEFFAAVDALPIADLNEICGSGGLVVVAPHPDDESLGCGGLIASARANGRKVRLIVLSDGTGSHAGSRKYPALQLRALREAETIAAVHELGLEQDDVTFLRLPDRSVPTDGPGAAHAQDTIVAAVKDCSASALCVTWMHDPHCDHAAAAQLIRDLRPRLASIRVLYYPIWGWTLPPDTEVGGPPLGWRFDVSAHGAAKAAAIAAHQSQTTDLIDDDPNGFRLAAEMLVHFDGPFETLLHAPAAR